MLSKTVMNLVTKEHALDLSYVVVSRVKSFQGLLFECSFDYDLSRLDRQSTWTWGFNWLNCYAIMDAGPARRLIPWCSALGTDQG
jgi:hypothetical protein